MRFVLPFFTPLERGFEAIGPIRAETDNHVPIIP
jgi:hypothetical protein